jgi:hypothetical protein
MSLTKVTYSMVSGAVLNVTDFGADPTGTTDSTAAIQAALDDSGDVWFPAGKYLITDSLKLSVSKRIKGEGGPKVNAGGSFIPGSIRTQCAILPRVAGNLSALGNYPVFVNKTGTTGEQYNIEGFNIFWENVTPLSTESATKGDRYGFKFVADGVAAYTAPYSTFTDIEINGAWQVYYDNSDNYLNKFKSVLGRFCRFGFYKRLGTLMHFEECGNSIGAQGFHFDNTVSPILINCAADALTPDASTPGFSANFFTDANSVSILGWDAEAATISGNDYSYMRFTRTYGTITGFTGLENTLNCAVGEFVTWFFFDNNSNVTVSAFNRKFNSSSVYQFVGSAGNVATVRSTGDSRCTLINSDVRSPSSGTPTNRYSVYSIGGFATVIDCIFDNQNEITTRIIDGNVITNALTASTQIGFTGSQYMYSGIAIPVSGSFNRGDIVLNATPSAGGTPGWVCVTSGTPGTWKAMANLAA